MSFVLFWHCFDSFDSFRFVYPRYRFVFFCVVFVSCLFRCRVVRFVSALFRFVSVFVFDSFHLVIDSFLRSFRFVVVSFVSFRRYFDSFRFVFVSEAILFRGAPPGTPHFWSSRRCRAAGRTAGCPGGPRVTRPHKAGRARTPAGRGRLPPAPASVLATC